MKKILSICLAIAMMFSYAPIHTVKAETVSQMDEAKGYIDAIVESAPTLEQYIFTEELAEQIDGLERVLRDITSSSVIDSLDSYVAEKTTVVITPEPTEEPDELPESTEEPEESEDIVITYYTSVREFSFDYSEEQKKVLQQLSAPITKAIQDMLSVPFTKENFLRAQQAYDAGTKHVRDAVETADVNALNQLHELSTLMERADTAFSRIEIPTSNSDEDDYTFFMKDYEMAKTAYGLYDSKFSDLKPKYYVCLQKDSKNALFENYELYAKATFHANVEKAYDELGVYDTFNTAIKEKMSVLKDAVEAGQKSEYMISVYDYYRGEDIQFVLDQYKHMTELEEMMTLVSEMPANKTELTAALRAYRYYMEDLTKEEKDMVPGEYVVKLNNAVLLNTSAEEVMAAIDEIGLAASEEEYEDYTSRYEKAYKAYRLFVNTYSGLSDVGSLITNVSFLNDSTEVLEMIRSIRQIESTEDATMCSKRLQMESVISGFERMSTEKQAGVYNINRLREIYADATLANDLRTKVDVVVNQHSLLDEQYVQMLHDDFDKLSETAKRYFGNDYIAKIQSIDRDLEVLNLNKALRVSTLINQIGKVTVKSKTQIDSARVAYDELTEAQKVYVPNYTTLTDAEAAFATLELSIEKATISELGSYSYSGIAMTPAVKVQLNGVTLTQDLDYQISYSSNAKVGTAKVKIVGIGSYHGTTTKTFTIRPCPVTGITISGFSNKYAYTGKSIYPNVKVGLHGKALKNGTDFVVGYKNNKKRGTASIIVTGIGNYTGTAQAFFVITRNTIKNAKVSGVKKAYVKTGKAIKPKLKVKVKGKILKKKRDYKVSYKKNKKRGTATITIKGIGNYSGTKKVKFKIV